MIRGRPGDQRRHRLGYATRFDALRAAVWLTLVCAIPILVAASPVQPQTPTLETLLAQGEAAINAGNAKLALATFEKALPLAEGTGDEVLAARSLAGLGWAQWASGQYDAALESRRRALEIVTRRGDVEKRTVLLKAMGETLFSMGRLEEALSQYTAALENNGKKPVPLQEGLILSNMGSAYRSLGRLNDAASVLERARTVLRTTGDPGAMGQVLTFLGIVNRARGEYDQALAFYREALEARRTAGDRRGESQVLGNMANVYLDLGQFEDSIELNRRSLAIAEEIGYTAQVGFANQNLGATLSHIPRPTEALKYYRAALDIHRKTGRQEQISRTLLSIGTLQAFVLGDRPAGRAALNEALEAAERVKSAETIARVRYELGSLDMAEGNLERAQAELTSALDAARQLQAPDLEYEVLANRGLLAHKMGRSEAALADLRASAKIVNDLRANVSSDQGKIAYVDTRQSVFHDLALVLTDVGRPEEALEVAEAGRARALADLLEGRRVIGSPAAREAIEEIRTARLNAPTGEPVTHGTRRGSDRLSTAVERLEQRDAELASLLAVASPTIEEIRGTARRLDATILEYLVTETKLFIWLVEPEGAVRHASRQLAASDLSRRIEALRRALDSATAADFARPDALSREFRELHDLLIGPVAQWLPASRSRRPLVIIPHGPTALVPFASLLDSDGTPLIERQLLSFAPSIATFRYTAAKRRATAWSELSALIVADPEPPKGAGVERLPGTLEEARRVAGRFGTRARVLSGRSATEAAVRQAVASRDVVHFATHGLISPIRPLSSSLLLAPSGDDDGYLRLDEVFGLGLSAELVVLSGCSTGLGRLTGDGIYGLTRGFMYAGTPSVIVSNWDVSDQATAYLMDRFYAALARGEAKIAALAQAQRETRRRYPHPALWAAFVLVGEPR